MSYETKNRGALFKNDRKQSDKAPDYSGKIDVNGKEYRLAAWIKDGKKGKFMSLAISEPQESGEKRQSEPVGTADPNDDLLF